MIVDLVRQCRESFDRGTTRPLEWRRSQLRALVTMLRTHEEEFAAALKTDLGRGPEEAWLYDVGFSITEIELMLKNLKKWTAPRKVPTPVVAKPGSSRRIPEPLGRSEEHTSELQSH